AHPGRRSAERLHSRRGVGTEVPQPLPERLTAYRARLEIRLQLLAFAAFRGRLRSRRALSHDLLKRPGIHHREGTVPPHERRLDGAHQIAEAPAFRSWEREMAEIEGQVKDEELDPEQQARRRLALAQIRQYPDAALRMAARPVEEFDDDLRRLIDRMKQLMADASGIG